jgi:hypothetical protein
MAANFNISFVANPFFRNNKRACAPPEDSINLPGGQRNTIFGFVQADIIMGKEQYLKGLD